MILSPFRGGTLFGEPMKPQPAPQAKLHHVVESQQFTVPLLMELFDRSRQMERIEADELQDAVRHAKDRLATNPEAAARADAAGSRP